MTNTKQLTSAVALLASIAVLDNFIFVELEPGFESMALIEPHGSADVAAVTQPSNRLRPQSEVQNFWIDQDKVSSADFAKFLESTSHEPFTVPPNTLQANTNRNGDFIAFIANDNWKTQVGNANWNEPNDKNSFPMPHTLAGQNDLKVSFKDALAYCNWLGKDLPTAEQFEYIATQDHDKQVSSLIEFRCVKNI